MTATASAADVLLRRHRDFRRYWVAREVSFAGTLVTAVALPVLVYRLSGSASLTALIAVAEGLPYLLLGLVSGALSPTARPGMPDAAGSGGQVVLAGPKDARGGPPVTERAAST